MPTSLKAVDRPSLKNFFLAHTIWVEVVEMDLSQPLLKESSLVFFYLDFSIEMLADSLTTFSLEDFSLRSTWAETKVAVDRASSAFCHASSTALIFSS